MNRGLLGKCCALNLCVLPNLTYCNLMCKKIVLMGETSKRILGHKGFTHIHEVSSFIKKPLLLFFFVMAQCLSPLKDAAIRCHLKGESSPH